MSSIPERMIVAREELRSLCVQIDTGWKIDYSEGEAHIQTGMIELATWMFDHLQNMDNWRFYSVSIRPAGIQLNMEIHFKD